MKKITILLCALLLLSMLSGCAPVSHVDIAATTLPVYEFTTRLCAGTPLRTERLVTEKISCLHDYSLKVSQMRTISAADIVVISGGGLEAFLHDALESATAVVDASEGIPLFEPGAAHEHANKHTHVHVHDHEHEHGHHHEHDPHFWLDPHRAQIMCRNICTALQQQYPQYQEIFRKNLDSLVADLEALWQYGHENLSDLKCQDLVTFHDGFAYFADSFGLHILTSVEEEPGSETSAAQLKDLILLVQEHELPAIFVEKNGSSASASVISAETGAACYALDMGMSGDSYFDAMYHNIDTIKEALG